MTPLRFWWAVLGLALAGLVPVVAPPWDGWRDPPAGPSIAALTPAHVSGMSRDIVAPQHAGAWREPDMDQTLQVHAESINALGEGLDSLERRLAGMAARIIAEEARSAALARDLAALAARMAAPPETAPTATPGAAPRHRKPRIARHGQQPFCPIAALTR